MGKTRAEASAHPEILYTYPKDYVILHQFLRHFTAVPGFCRVVCIGASLSKVYKITFPQWDDSSGLAVVDLSEGGHHIAVKVVTDEQSFRSEAVCLQTVADDASHYAIGYAAHGHKPYAFHEKWSDYLSIIKQQMTYLTDHCRHLSMCSKGWWHEKPQGEATGGLIMMRVADYRLSSDAKMLLMKTEKNQLRQDAIDSLRKFHAKHVLREMLDTVTY